LIGIYADRFHHRMRRIDCRSTVYGLRACFVKIPRYAHFYVTIRSLIKNIETEFTDIDDDKPSEVD
jgi:hypothetical protein